MEKKYVVTTNCIRSDFFINEVQEDGSLQCVEIVPGEVMTIATFRNDARSICGTVCEHDHNSVACASCGADITDDEGDGYCIHCSNNQRGEDE